jgi:hypothetical protein
MGESPLTPEEFELHLKDLRERLSDHLEGGEGDSGRLLKESEEMLALSRDFPDIMARYPDVEGMVADVLARDKQREVFGTGQEGEAPGCALGWLLGRQR